MMENLRLSIVIPAFNESKRIGKTLSELDRYLKEQNLTSEVIVVDDGSRDDTAEVSQRQGLANLRVLVNERNCGKGYSVRRGLMAAKAPVMLFADADGATAFHEIADFLKVVSEGNDVVIASRAVKGSNIIVHQPALRRMMGFVFRNLVRAMFAFPYADTQCGFKMFTKKAAETILPRCRENGFSFDVEMLYWARRANLKVREVGVTWTDHRESKVNFLKGPVRMLMELLKLRLKTIVPYRGA